MERIELLFSQLRKKRFDVRTDHFDEVSWRCVTFQTFVSRFCRFQNQEEVLELLTSKNLGVNAKHFRKPGQRRFTNLLREATPVQTRRPVAPLTQEKTQRTNVLVFLGITVQQGT